MRKKILTSELLALLRRTIQVVVGIQVLDFVNWRFFDRLWIGIMDLAGVWWLIRRKKSTPAVTEVF